MYPFLPPKILFTLFTTISYIKFTHVFQEEYHKDLWNLFL